MKSWTPFCSVADPSSKPSVFEQYQYSDARVQSINYLRYTVFGESPAECSQICLWDYSRFHSVTAMLDKQQWPTLKDRRHHLIAAMMYKIVNNLIDIEASLYLTPITSATRGHSRRYLYIQTRINAYLHSFFPSAVRIWNRLPAQLVNATSLENLKF